jgi:hypothetical protein
MYAADVRRNTIAASRARVLSLTLESFAREIERDANRSSADPMRGCLPAEHGEALAAAERLAAILSLFVPEDVREERSRAAAMLRRLLRGPDIRDVPLAYEVEQDVAFWREVADNMAPE